MSLIDVSTLCRFLPVQSFSITAKRSPRGVFQCATMALTGLTFFSHNVFALESTVASAPAPRSVSLPASAPASATPSTFISSASAANVSAANLSSIKTESAANERIPTITIIGKRMTEKQKRAWDQAHPQ